MDVDFTKLYKRGDKIYLVRCINVLEVSEVVMLKLRTVFPNYMVGCSEKSNVFLIGDDWINNLFPTMKEANAYLKKISKPIIHKVEEE